MFATGEDGGADRHMRHYAQPLMFEHNLVATFVAIEDHVFTGFLAVGPAYLEKVDPKPRATRVLRASRIAANNDRIHDELLRYAMVLTVAKRSPLSQPYAGLLVDVLPSRVARYEQLGFLHLDDVVEGQLHGGAQPMFIERAPLDALFAAA